MLKLPTKVSKIISQFDKNQFELYVVGGFIRDQLLNRRTDNKGIDLTTNATPEEILRMFPQAKYENRFGTVIVPLVDKDYFEITTFRTESSYSDKRHPDQVKWGKTLAEDLKRRDFTINALAYDGKKLVDLFAGQADLKSKIIRTVGSPEIRFEEDALRMMRAIRMASELSFTIEPTTLMAITKQAPLLKQISKERIRDEFLKILKSDHAFAGVTLLRNTNLLDYFLPELKSAFGVGQKSPNRHHIYDVGTHLLYSLKECANPDPIVRLACLLHDIGKPKVRQVQADGIVTFYNHEVVSTEIAYRVAKGLKLNNKELEKLTKLVRYHQFSVSEIQTDSALRRFIKNVGKENLKDIIDLRIADRIGSGAKASSWRTELFLKRLEEVQKKPFTVHDLKISGNEVMKITNLKPGPKIGKILDELFEKVVKEELKNNRKELIKYLKKVTY